MTKKMCVVGLGYIGLPTAVMFADHGFNVLGVDINEEAVNQLNNKQLHIEEPGLQERLETTVDKGLFRASTVPETADVYILAVPSPINEDKTANLDYVRAAAESIVPFLQKGNLVILESTVPPRTVEDVLIPVLKKSNLHIGEELFVSHSPERVIPGKLFEELVNNDRIVGGINAQSTELTVQLYKTFVKGTIHKTDATTAELVKVMENTYRDVNIALANELAQIGEKLGVNIWEAIQLANYHPRVNIHYPGPGVGGHCIAVDPWFIVEQAPDLAKLILLSRNINDHMPDYVVDKVRQLASILGIEDPKIAVWGLSFKGNIDDMRGTPSMEVIKGLERQGYAYTVFDPHIRENKVPNQTQSVEDSVNGADFILVLTDHDYYKAVDVQKLKGLMRHAHVVDTRNLLNRDEWKAAGFVHFRLGDSKNTDIDQQVVEEVAVASK